jgi:predicted histidine transporter YuiF (NhaC family)
MKNYNILKEILFEDLDRMSKSDRYKTLFVALLYLPFVLILFPIVAIKKYRKRKDYYRQANENNDANKMNINHNNENNDISQKEEYNKQA